MALTFNTKPKDKQIKILSTNGFDENTGIVSENKDKQDKQKRTYTTSHAY